MEDITDGVNNINISSDSYKKNRIQVSNTKKPLFFYVNLAKVIHIENPPLFFLLIQFSLRIRVFIRNLRLSASIDLILLLNTAPYLGFLYGLICKFIKCFCGFDSNCRGTCNSITRWNFRPLEWVIDLSTLIDHHFCT